MDELDCIQILPFESRNTVPRHALFPTASPRQVGLLILHHVSLLFSYTHQTKTQWSEVLS